MDRTSTERAVCLLNCLPNGVQAMSGDIPAWCRPPEPGHPHHRGGGAAGLLLGAQLLGSQKEALKDRLTCLTRPWGAEPNTPGTIRPGNTKRTHLLRDRMVQVFREQYGREPKVEAIHAGVECGLLAGKIPGLDCVSSAPTCWRSTPLGSR